MPSRYDDHGMYKRERPLTARTSTAHVRALPRWLWVTLLLFFPAVVGLFIWRTLDTLESQRAFYLRSRVATIAAHIEALPPSATDGQSSWATDLYEEEPSLVDARIYTHPDESPIAAEIFAQRELYRLENIVVSGEPLFRAWLPAHRSGALRVVRLDFAASAADFLNSYAIQSMVLVTLIATALVGLSAYTFHLAGKAATLQRREAERDHLARLGEMAAVLAHEIRNPLGSIKGFGQLLREGATERHGSYAQEIVEQSERLERLVNDLLRFGRVPEPRLAPVSWAAIAQRVEHHWHQELRQHEAESTELTLSVIPSDIEINTDVELLEHAIDNLVRNSREALGACLDCADPGRVSVRVSCTKRETRITVEDNGPGLSAEAIAHLFEPFFTTKAFGTGLGLAITQRFAAALGGTLELAPGERAGTVATILLPSVSRELN